MDSKKALQMLPGRIKVRIVEDYMGNIIVKPVSEHIQDLIAATNEYDHTYDIYLQTDYDRQWFIENYPKARFYHPEGDYSITHNKKTMNYFVNDGVIFLMDSWDFRRMVGGQSD